MLSGHRTSRGVCADARTRNIGPLWTWETIQPKSWPKKPVMNVSVRQIPSCPPNFPIQVTVFRQHRRLIPCHSDGYRCLDGVVLLGGYHADEVAFLGDLDAGDLGDRPLVERAKRRNMFTIDR
jgi:hypothetical protein